MNSELMQKEKDAIERLKAFEPKDGDPYYLCYSGGKDSDCIRILAQLAGVRHEIHHNLTTVDAPETIAYIKTIPNVMIDKARYDDGTPKTMWNLIPKKKIPPTRLVRWCCSELKESGGKGRLLITGVRWSESQNRRDNQGGITVIGKSKDTQRFLESQNVNFLLTKRGGVVLNFDNEILRDNYDIMSHCFRTRTTMLNPIVEWSDKDVWDFLHHYGCSANPLYQCGEARIGCIGCPLAGAKQQKKDFAKYPKYKQNYIMAFDNLVRERWRLGLKTDWTDGKDVLKWWLGDDRDQLTLFDEDELYEILSDIGG